MKTLATSIQHDYRFRPEDLPCPALIQQPALDDLVSTYHFQSCTLEQDPAGQTIAVCRLGIFPVRQEFLSLKALSIGPGRIEIDMVGTSLHATIYFEDLWKWVCRVGQLAAGTYPAITSLQQQSTVTARLGFSAEALLAPALRTALTDLIGQSDQTDAVADAQQRLAGLSVQFERPAFVLGLDRGSDPAEHIYVSTAPLTTEEHCGWLQAIENGLLGQAVSQGAG